MAYLSPNPGEGLSVKYAQIEDGRTDNPPQPLQNFIDSDTKITNSNNQKIQLKDIKYGDNLIVRMSAGPCIMGVIGGPSGCRFKIFSIQDISL